MDRRRFLGTTATAGLALIASPYVARAAKQEVLVAEPVHSIGYLPLYVAIAKNYFGDDIDVKTVTIDSASGHTNAVLSGQAFAFIGGAEHCALAKAKGAELRAVVHCVDRGNVYLCAAKGIELQGRDFAGLVKGKTFATGSYGGTPSSITRYLLQKWNVDIKKDLTLIEAANAAVLPAVRGKQAQIGCSAEPYITQGVAQSIWNEPFFNVPKELGPYAYSTFNVRLDSIKKEPEVVRAFVRGMMKGLKDVYADKEGAAAVARKQFPTMPMDDMKATLDRSYADDLWSRDGMVSKQAWDTCKAVVMAANVLKVDIGYDEIIDMSFVESLRSSI
jgi:NitT/TauT family transport system substrate-binding protein